MIKPKSGHAKYTSDYQKRHVIVRVERELHNKIVDLVNKIKVTDKNYSIKKYIENLINEDFKIRKLNDTRGS